MNTPTTSQKLPGTIQAAIPGLRGFDTAATITTASATQFKNTGYDFCVRYLSLGSVQSSGDLSNQEAVIILNAGLALSVVQHVLAPGWSPTQASGTTYGTNAGNNARSIGLPAGMVVWCDLEGILASTPAQNVIDYCQAWYSAVLAAGYIPGLYVGGGCILNGTQLANNLAFQHYWQSQSLVPSLSSRGYQMVQLYPTITNVTPNIDINFTQTDHKNGTVLWLKV